MTLRLDPRGDLSLSSFPSIACHRSRSSLLNINSGHSNRRLSSLSLGKPRVKPCYDWILSSASNVHIALDKSAFKEYMPFQSYVLTLSDHRQVLVAGIGTVEVKIRRTPESKENHTVLLQDVLHVPSWVCNIFSDIYFSPGHDYDHSWTSLGLQLFEKGANQLRPWGYTENFCSLDRLVLAKRYKDRRSPMLEDRDREVFSINVKWPQSQRDRWQEFLASPTEFNSPYAKSPDIKLRRESRNTLSKSVPRRATFSDLSVNIIHGAPSKRVSSLKGTVKGKSILRETE